MDSGDTLIVILSIALAITLACCLVYMWRRYDETRYVSISDEELGANKLWVGENPTERDSSLDILKDGPSTEQIDREEARLSEKMKRFRRASANYCRSSQHEIKIDMELPFIGTRRNCKSHCVVRNSKIDQKYEGKYAVMFAQISRGDIDSSCKPCFDWESVKQKNQIKNFLLEVSHPYVMDTLEVGFGVDAQNLFVMRWMSDEGSLRDHIYEVTPLQEVHDKYPRTHMASVVAGRPLRVDKIRQYSREILEGLLFFKNIGMPYYNLHSGNCILVKGRIMLSDYENCLFGFKSRVHDSIRKLPVDPQVAAFGAVLYEMCTGKQMPRPIKGKVTLTLDRDHGDFEFILEDIFTNTKLTLEKVAKNPLFSGVPVKYLSYDRDLLTRTRVAKMMNVSKDTYEREYMQGRKSSRRVSNMDAKQRH